MGGPLFGVRILAVDDDPDSLAVAAFLLRAAKMLEGGVGARG